jgi:hypothetical protein
LKLSSLQAFDFHVLTFLEKSIEFILKHQPFETKVLSPSITIFLPFYHYFTIFAAPLKLSAPTSLMQNANTDATLVCHANKPYDECLWTTPYGATYR